MVRGFVVDNNAILGFRQSALGAWQNMFMIYKHLAYCTELNAESPLLFHQLCVFFGKIGQNHF